MSDPDEQKLQKRFCYLELITAALTAVLQLVWLTAAVKFDHYVGLSFVLIALFCCSAFFFPHRLAWRAIYLICQIMLICVASAFGVHHFYYLILFVLAAKAAVFLPRTQMLAVAAFLLCAHFAAGQFAEYANRDIHVHRRPVPAYYKIGILEGHSYLYFAISLATVTLLGRTLIAERKGRNAEHTLRKEVQELAIKFDRGRIARDVHDGLGHNLTSSRIQLELAQKALENKNKEAALEFVRRCQASTAASMQEVRIAVRTAQHGVLSLKQTVMMLVDELKQQTELTFKVHLDDVRLLPKVQHQVFSIIKECLTNVRKHSKAKHVELTLTKFENEANLCLSDDGKGFELDTAQSGFGLRGLEERAESIGARLKVESKISGGTRILLYFPCI